MEWIGEVNDASQFVILGIDDRLNSLRFGATCLSRRRMERRYPDGGLYRAFWQKRRRGQVIRCYRGACEGIASGLGASVCPETHAGFGRRRASPGARAQGSSWLFRCETVREREVRRRKGRFPSEHPDLKWSELPTPAFLLNRSPRRRELAPQPHVATQLSALQAKHAALLVQLPECPASPCPRPQTPKPVG